MAEQLQMSCDTIVTTMEEAERPIVTPLLPVSGLRRDEKGVLTEDAVRTVMEGVKSLGIQSDDESTKDALLQEARKVLCILNKQYVFLLGLLLTTISRSENVEPKLLDALKGKNQSMQDILSVSRYILDKMPTKKVEGFVEGFIGTQGGSAELNAMREAFQAAQTEVTRRTEAFQNGDLMDLKQRGVAVTEEKNRYASNMLGLYGFLNIVAAGFILYIVTSN